MRFGCLFYYGGIMKSGVIISMLKSLSRFERILWCFSLLTVTLSYIFSPEFMPVTFIASLIGVTSLIFIAKGNAWGQILMLIFGILYAVISYRQRYYGEMITYLAMTAPAALISAVTWFRHPYEKGKNEVKISRLNVKKIFVICFVTTALSFVFYFLLKYFNTANLFWSTVSIATSLLASLLTFLRSSYYALAYSANDIILIILWISASLESPGNIPMIACFSTFFINDLYGFINWRKMQILQKA